MFDLENGVIITNSRTPKPPKGRRIIGSDLGGPQQAMINTSKSLDASDIASAVAMWAKANGYRVYSCGTEQLQDGRIVVEAMVRR